MIIKSRHGKGEKMQIQQTPILNEDSSIENITSPTMSQQTPPKEIVKSAFFFFCEAKRNDVVELLTAGGKKPTRLEWTMELGKLWRSLSVVEQKPYVECYDKEKRLNDEMREKHFQMLCENDKDTQRNKKMSLHGST